VSALLPKANPCSAEPMSAKGHKRTWGHLFNDLIGAGEHGRRQGEAEGLGPQYRQLAPTNLRHIMKRHANDKQSNACTHCNEPSACLRIHDLDPALLRGQPQPHCKVHGSGADVLSRKQDCGPTILMVAKPRPREQL
jgi:hypothetical protein